MNGVDPRLQHIAHLALVYSAKRGGPDFTIPTFGGLRTEKEQQWLVDNKRSKTMNSKHRLGLALDVIPYSPNWRQSVYTLPKAEQDRLFHDVAVAMFGAASQLGIQIVWGGNWRGRWDMPHFELIMEDK